MLYPKRIKAPRDVSADLAIAVPVRRVVLYSTTYIPAIEAIGELDAVVGVDNAAYIYNSALRTQIATGKTIETSKTGCPI